MQVTVRLFAGLREVAGSDRLVEDFDGQAVTVETLRARLEEAHPGLRPYLSGVAIAVNEEYILEPGTTLSDGDTVALIPPIAGGSDSTDGTDAAGAGGEAPLYLVTAAVLEPRALREAVMTPASGACVVFEGVVRDHHEGRAVERVEYEAYEEMAERQLRAVGEEVLRDFAGREVHAAGIHHRTGPLDVGETSLLVAVSAAHRRDAFEAALRAVDRVKETVPVWKKEWGPDGSHWQEGVQPRPGTA
ncbi:MAG: molybdenum cofactor biosynthesis protein MoaE [Dehalococcoidia bacterium]|nr:molybdenum cofactor biosynthesis protein MoaE [Dehalococcoidia bacterium]